MDLYNQNMASMLLGCLMRQPSLLYLPQYPLEKSDFSPVEFHKDMFIFIAMLADDDAQEITEVEIEDKAKEHPVQFEVLQDNDYMDFVATSKTLCVPENYELYYKVVRKYSLLRELKKKGIDISEFCDENGESSMSIPEILSKVEVTSIMLRSKYDVDYVRDEIIAGQDTQGLLDQFKEHPAMGAMLQSGYLSRIWNGWSRGHLLLRGGGSSSGKAIPYDTWLPTPDGQKQVWQIKEGDYLYDRMGKPTKVLGIFPQGQQPVYKITFADGRTAECSPDHLWTFRGYGRTYTSTAKIWKRKIDEGYNFRLLKTPLHPSRQSQLRVMSIEDLGVEKPMTCFLVDNKEHLFLMGDYIPTHNTRCSVGDLCSVGMTDRWDPEFGDFVVNENYQGPTLFIATEQDIRTEVEPMFLAAVSGVEYYRITHGETTEEEDKRVLKAGEIISKSGLTISSMPNFTAQSIRRKIQEQVEVNGISYLVFDYMEVQSSLSTEYKKNNATVPRQDLILLNLTSEMKMMAEDFNVGILTGMQLSEGWKDARFVDESFLAGSKAAKNKIDNGSIIVPTNYLRREMKILDPCFIKRGVGIAAPPKPNICEYIFKGRYSIYGDKRLKLWSFFDRGTFQRIDYFVTDDDNNILYEIKPIELEECT